MNIQSPLGGRGMAPSNASAAPRAFLLITVAVVLGLVIMWKGLDNDPSSQFSSKESVSSEAVLLSEQQPADLPPLVDLGEVVATSTTVAVATTTTSQPPLPTKPPSTVKILVLNGSGVGGAAGAVTDKLNPEGYTTLPPANGNKDVKSWIYYKTDFAPDAKGVTEILRVPPDLLTSFPSNGLTVPETSQERVETANIVIFLGSDKEIFAG